MKRSELRRRSKRQARTQRELAHLTPALVARSRGRCEARFSQWCTGGGSQVHHVLKRSQSRDHTDPAVLLWVCGACNLAIEDEPDRAHARALSIRSFERERFLEWMRPHVPDEAAAGHNFATCLEQAREARVSFQAMFEIVRLARLGMLTGQTHPPTGDYRWCAEDVHA